MRAAQECRPGLSGEERRDEYNKGRGTTQTDPTREFTLVRRYRELCLC